MPASPGHTRTSSVPVLLQLWYLDIVIWLARSPQRARSKSTTGAPEANTVDSLIHPPLFDASALVHVCQPR